MCLLRRWLMIVMVRDTRWNLGRCCRWGVSMKGPCTFCLRWWCSGWERFWARVLRLFLLRHFLTLLLRYYFVPVAQQTNCPEELSARFASPPITPTFTAPTPPPCLVCSRLGVLSPSFINWACQEILDLYLQNLQGLTQAQKWRKLRQSACLLLLLKSYLC